MRWRKPILEGEANPPPPDPDSVNTMAELDDVLPPEWRALVHEFGREIVVATWNEGARNAEAARNDLETWRDRRQEAIGNCDWGPNEAGRREKMMLSSAPRTGPVRST